jgi:hypothetical protein
VPCRCSSTFTKYLLISFWQSAMNLRTGCTYSHRSPAQVHPVCRSYRHFGITVVGHLDERKASRLICLEIGHHLKPLHSKTPHGSWWKMPALSKLVVFLEQ